MTTPDDNRQHALEFVEAFATWEPERYERHLADEPRWRIAHQEHVGRAALAAIATHGSQHFPGGLTFEVVSTVASGNQVGLDLVARGVTASGVDYENLHAIVAEFDDAGRITTLFDHSDTAHLAATLRLGELGAPAPNLAFDPVPRNIQTTIAFFAAFLTWDPHQYERYLNDDPVYQGGRSVMQGREGFHRIALLGKHLYPNGLHWEIETIFGEDRRVFLRLVVRAVPNRGIPYENYYAMAFDFDEDGRIAAQREYVDTAYAALRFDYPTGGRS